MHIIVERMIPFPEDDARIQGLKVRAETYACEKNIVKSEIIFIHMHMSWVYVYIYILYRVLFIFIVQTFSGYNILSRNSNGTAYFRSFIFFLFLLFFSSFQIQTLRLYDYQSYLRELCVLSSRNTIASYIDHRVLST